MKNILEYLEKTVKQYPQKTAVDDGKSCLSYEELELLAKKMGSVFCEMTEPGKPVVLLLEKSTTVLAAMFGVVYAGGFYVIVDPSQPAARLSHIFQTLQTTLVITNSKNENLLDAAGYKGSVYLLEGTGLEAIISGEINEKKLLQRREQGSIDDLLYGIFTSGSTGTPKGIVVSHRAVIDFITHFTETFGIEENDRIGNQAPFDFDVSVKDIYSAMMTGATLVLIPRELFSTPPRLLDYLCEKKVTTIIWAVSALSLVSMLKGLDYKIPSDIKRVMFSGEVMPIKQLTRWQKALPEAAFVNLYGPTEITCNCTYYPIERMFEMSEKLPIGKPFEGREIFLLDEKDEVVKNAGEIGEICVAGESIAAGYYNNPEETGKRFVEYPDENGTKRRCYRTGDLGYFGEDGELYFSGRKDFQIKHMGHRIELEEIEKALEQIPGVTRSCCLFDTARNRLAAFYLGEAAPAQVRREMKSKVPVYMVPSKLFLVEEMPLNKNGKTDRKYFEKMLEV